MTERDCKSFIRELDELSNFMLTVSMKLANIQYRLDEIENELTAMKQDDIIVSEMSLN